MGGSSDDSFSDDAEAGLQAQVASMLGPLNSKLKKALKKINKLEVALSEQRQVGDDQLPAMRKELATNGADVSARLERTQAEVAQCASKTSLEVVRQEQSAVEQRLRALLEEERGKAAAQQLVVQGLESRMEAMERASRASELRVGGELSAAIAQLSQLSAALERQRGEMEARMSEASARACAQHDGMLARMSAAEEAQHALASGFATQAQLAELNATVGRRADEADASFKAVNAQCRQCAEAVEGVQASLMAYASVQALERLDARCEALATDVGRRVETAAVSGGAERAAWEDKLMQRQHGLEASAHEARRDWHRLSAQIEQLQSCVTERALLTEHEQLASRVEQLREVSATKEALDSVAEVAHAATDNATFSVLEAEVRSVAANVKAEAAANAERFGRTADAEAVSSLESAVRAVSEELDGKMGAQQAAAALAAKLDKVAGEQMGAELRAVEDRVSTLHNRASAAEQVVSESTSASGDAAALVADMQSRLEELGAKHDQVIEDCKQRGSDIYNIVRAVRALTQDAEMRCSLDEREIEFLWAAPGHIYGAHGWRPNNGSKSERTPYPAGNFKMAVRHGSEGNARDVLERRKQWLNSITLGAREVRPTPRSPPT